MDACLAVERDIDKVISKFDEISTQTSNQLDDLLVYVNNIKKELEEREFIWARLIRNRLDLVIIPFGFSRRSIYFSKIT